MGKVYDAAGQGKTVAFSAAGISLGTVFEADSTPVVLDVSPVPTVGSVSVGTGYGDYPVYVIALDGAALPAGTYTLRYEDAAGVPLTDRRDVCSLAVQ